MFVRFFLLKVFQMSQVSICHNSSFVPSVFQSSLVITMSSVIRYYIFLCVFEGNLLKDYFCLTLLQNVSLRLWELIVWFLHDGRNSLKYVELFNNLAKYIRSILYPDFFLGIIHLVRTQNFLKN